MALLSPSSADAAPAGRQQKNKSGAEGEAISRMSTAQTTWSAGPSSPGSFQFVGIDIGDIGMGRR